MTFCSKPRFPDTFFLFALPHLGKHMTQPFTPSKNRCDGFTVWAHHTPCASGRVMTQDWTCSCLAKHIFLPMTEGHKGIPSSSLALKDDLRASPSSFGATKRKLGSKENFRNSDQLLDVGKMDERNSRVEIRATQLPSDLVNCDP